MTRRVPCMTLVLMTVLTVACLGLKDCNDDPTSPGSDISVSCTAAPESGRAPMDVRFTAAANGLSDAEKRSLTYKWSFGDGTYASQAAVVKTYHNGGTYQVTVTAQAGDHQGTCQKTIRADADVRIDSCSASPDHGQAPLGVQFRSMAKGSGQNPVTYAWNFGDGGTSNEAEPQHSYSAVGPQIATLVATSNGSSAQCSVGVNVYGPLNVSCSAAPTEGTAPVVISFDADVPGQSGCSYVWDFDDGITVARQKTDHKYVAGSLYHPTVTATCGTQQGSCRQNVLVHQDPNRTPPPSPTAPPPTSPSPSPSASPTPNPACATAGTFTFTGTGTPVTKVWSDTTILAPVNISGITSGCHVTATTSVVAFSSSVDLSTLGGIAVAIGDNTTGQGFIDSGTGSNVPAAFAGSSVGGACGSLHFDTGSTTSFSTAVAPYVGTYRPAWDYFVGSSTNALNGHTFNIGIRAPSAGDVTVNCWSVTFTVGP